MGKKGWARHKSVDYIDCLCPTMKWDGYALTAMTVPNTQEHPWKAKGGPVCVCGIGKDSGKDSVGPPYIHVRKAIRIVPSS